MTGTLTPAASAIVEQGEHCLGRLVCWRSRKNGNDHASCPNDVPPNGDIVEITEKVHACKVQGGLRAFENEPKALIRPEDDVQRALRAFD